MPNYCCVRLCKNEGKPFAFHQFPNDVKLRQQWLHVIRRKGSVNINTRVCSAHFKKDDYRITLLGERSRLIRGAVPSLFSWTRSTSPNVDMREAINGPNFTDQEPRGPLTMDDIPTAAYECISMETVKFETVWLEEDNSLSTCVGTDVKMERDSDYESSSRENLLQTDAVVLDNSLEGIKSEIEIEENCILEESSEFIAGNRRSQQLQSSNGTASTSPDFSERIEPQESAQTEYKCEVCGKCFSRSSGLVRHMRTHTGEKPFKCNVCSKRFSDASNLAQHGGTHTGEKPFKCTTCSKCFSRSTLLAKHAKTHTGEKPFKCETCSKCFAVFYTLVEHIRTHTGEKRFKCDLCIKHFSRSSSLATHRRTHTGEKPFKCKMCSKCFSDTSTLAKHVRTHTGEKPFQCEICTKHFSQCGILGRHMRTHTGEKAFKCKMCNKCFSQSNGLAKHVRSHRDEKLLTL